MVSSDRTMPVTDRGLLAGVKVLSLGAFVAGNVCPLILAELGADVVKVESRSHPEALRSYYSPDHGAIREPSGQQTTALYACLTRSMRSLCLQLDTAGGPALLRSLTSEADIVIENLGHGVMERWECGYNELTALNPRIVMVSISGYGRSGPRGPYRAYASSIGNFLGLTSIWAPDGTHFDYVAGYHASFAAVGAWRQARDTGRGAFLDVAQIETGAAVMAPVYLDALANGRPWAHIANTVPGSLLSSVVRCAGADAWAAIELEDLADWKVMCDLLDQQTLVATSTADAKRFGPDLIVALERWTASLTPYQVALKLQAAGLAAAPVHNGEDVWRDPQLRERGAFMEVLHPDLGMIEHPQSPDRMSKTPGRIASRSRRLGEDTEAVLTDWLTMDPRTIGSLEDDGVVWQPSDPPSGGASHIVTS
jgi:benzylsuccinate CoA-transferase BbsF subunit